MRPSKDISSFGRTGQKMALMTIIISRGSGYATAVINNGASCGAANLKSEMNNSAADGASVRMNMCATEGEAYSMTPDIRIIIILS